MNQPTTVEQLLKWWRGDGRGAGAPAVDGPHEAIDDQMISELGKPNCKVWHSPRLTLTQMIFGEGMDTPGGDAAIEPFRSTLALDSSKTLVDFGAGLGGLGFAISRHFGCRSIGIESNPALVAAGNRIAAQVGIERHATIRPFANGFAQFKPASIDAVVSKERLFYLPQRPALFAAAARALQPGGQFVFTDIVVGRKGPGESVRQWIAEEPQVPRPMPVHDIEAAMKTAGLELADSRDISTAYHDAIVAAFNTFGERVEGGVYETKWKAWAVAEAHFWQARLHALFDGSIAVHFFAARRTASLSMADFL